MAASKFSFSIRAILIATAYTAIVLVAMVRLNEIWLGAMYGITLGLLFFSGLGAIYRTGRARAYWTGFALFGFGYLGLLFGPFASLSFRLPTTLLLAYTHKTFYIQTNSPYGSSRPSFIPPGYNPYTSPGPFPQIYTTRDSFIFCEIGHAVFALVFAAIGGLMAQFLFSSRQGARVDMASPQD